MVLNNNPFYLLKVSCDAGRREIVSASDEMSFLLDPEICSKAQNELINLNKRLAAEINWFIDSDEETISGIRMNIENDEPVSTDGLPPLSKLNATLYNFSLTDCVEPFELGYAILNIDKQYGSLNVDEIANTINVRRGAAKLASVQSRDVAEELGKKREEIRQVITDKLSELDSKTYIEFVTMLAEKYIADDEYDDGVILSDVIDQYEVRMQSSLEEKTEEIEKLIEGIKSLTNTAVISDNVKSLIQRVKQWDVLAQPLQLKSQASGLPHKISENLGSELRGLALYLHNEKGLTKDALILVDAMKGVFAELGSLAEIFDSDSGTLSDLLRGKNEAEEVVAEIKALKDESDRIIDNPLSGKVESFIARVKVLDKRLKAMDLDAGIKGKARENLCFLARGTAVALHNNRHQTSLAITITRTLVDEFGDVPSLRIKLIEDLLKLTQQQNQSPISPTRYGSSSTPSSVRRSSSNNSGCVSGAIVFAVLIVFFLIVSAIGSCNSTSSNKRTTSSYSQSSTTKTSSTETLYKVTFDKADGSGGTSSVNVKNGSPMPSATAPSRSGYDFKGYYSLANGKGTQYYDANMKSTHNWDKTSDSTLYAYWKKKIEKKYSSSASQGDLVYVDIVSIFPSYGIYSQVGTHVDMNYSHFVCECKTSAGATVWIYMTTDEYKTNFDASVNTSRLLNSADTVTLSPSKRIHGTMISANSIVKDLSADTGSYVIKFLSVS